MIEASVLFLVSDELEELNVDGEVDYDFGCTFRIRLIMCVAGIDEANYVAED